MTEQRTAWKELRVFISSTFRDMQTERDYLVRFVFPRLREELLKRRIHLVDVDLRWGVTADQDAFDLCMDEIDRCRPRFICLLGGRYGWVPAPKTIPADFIEVLKAGRSVAGELSQEEQNALERLYAPDDHASEYRLRDKPREAKVVKTWEAEANLLVNLFWRAELPGLRSITASEIHYGVLDRLNQPGYCYFYFRKKKVTDSIPDEFASGYRESPGSFAAQALPDLKTGITTSVDPKPFVYNCAWDSATRRIVGLEDLGERVYADLLASVEAELGAAVAVEEGEFAEEEAAQEAFIESCVERYVVGSRKPIFERLRTYVEGSDPGRCLCLVGNAGSGKSALLAKFCRDYLPGTLEPPARLEGIEIIHFVGVGSTNVRLILRRLCGQLARATGTDAEVPMEYEKLKDAFVELLRKAAVERRVVICIDAINQLDTAYQASSMKWLPETLPDNVRIILTCLPCPALEALRSRPQPPAEIALPPLSGPDEAAIVEGWLARYRKTLDDEQRGLLQAKKDADNPLYLLAALEELRTLGTYEQITTRIRELPGETKPLFDWILDRLETDPIFRDEQNRLVGKKLVQGYCAYLSIARQGTGMSHAELVDLVCPNDPQGNLAAIQRLLRPYLMKRGTLIDFFHGQLCEAVQSRYLGTRGEQLEAHRELAQYFQQRADPSGAGTWDGNYPRGLSELPYHLTQAEMWKALHNTLTDFRFLERKAADIDVMERTDAEGNKLKTYTGVLLLQDDFELALERLSLPRRMSEMPVGSPDIRKTIDAFARAFGREAHVLMSRPDLLWQQLYNRLYWEASPGDETVLAEILRRGLEARRTDPRPWFRQMNQVAESGPLVRTLVGHQGEVNACQFNPEGKEIVSAGADGTLRLWDRESGELLTVLGEQLGDVLCCAFSSDGRLIASGHLDGSLRLWDVATYHLSGLIETGLGAVFACAFSRDGEKILASGAEGSLALWNVATKKLILRTTSQGKEVLSCDLSADARLAVSGGSDGAVTLWNMEKGQTEAVLWGPDAPTYCCRFSPDASSIVSAHSDGAVRLFDTVVQKERASFTGHEGEVLTCNFSPDGTKIVSAGMDGTVRVWEVSSGDEILVLRGHTAWINSCSFDAGSRYVVSGSADETLKIWDVTSGSSVLAVGGHRRAVVGCAFSQSGRWLATASGDETVRIWDVQKGAVVSVLKHSSPLMSASFSPDEKLLVAGCLDRTIHAWEWAAEREFAILRGHVNGVSACLFTANGKQVVSASEDKTIRLWDVGTSSEIAKLSGHSAGVHSCALSPDGNRLVSASEDGSLKIWDLKRLCETATLRGHTKRVLCCRFSPDGTKIASASFDRTVKIWDAASGEEVCTLAGHAAEVRACTFSPDGRLVAWGDWDKMIYVWDWASGVEVALYPALGNLLCCEFSPVEYLVAAGDESENLYLLRLTGVEDYHHL